MLEIRKYDLYIAFGVAMGGILFSFSADIKLQLIILLPLAIKCAQEYQKPTTECDLNMDTGLQAYD